MDISSNKWLILGIIGIVAVGTAIYALTIGPELMENEARQSADNAQEDMQQRGLETSTSIDIVAAYRSSDGNTALTLRNTGSSPLPVQENGDKQLAVSIDGEKTGSDGKNWNILGDEVQELRPGQTLDVGTEITFPESGSHTFKVEASHGSEAVHRCEVEGDSCM